jgi:rSAM/selenodomain-associated transferase 1
MGRLDNEAPSASSVPDQTKNAGIIGVMTKYWLSGTVKTRLHGVLGSRRATDLHHVLVTHTLRILRDSEFPGLVSVAPAEMADVLADQLNLQCAERRRPDHRPATSGEESVPPQEIQPWRAVAQIGWKGREDLGGRLEFFARHLLDGGNATVILGTDCPRLSVALVRQAFDHLKHADVVIGPARDGGYYLLGLKGPWIAPYESLFREIPWSTESVAELTRQKAIRQGLRVQHLKPLDDVDTPDDLQDLRQFCAEPDCPREFATAIAEILGNQ